MSNRGNRFKKIGFKLKNFSSKVDDFVLGPDFNSKKSDNEDDFSNLDHIIVPEHNDNYVLEDFSGSRDSSPLVSSKKTSSLIGDDERFNDGFNKFSDDLNEKEADNNSWDGELESRYSKYLDPGLDNSKENYLNELNFSLDDLADSNDDFNSDGNLANSGEDFNSEDNLANDYLSNSDEDSLDEGFSYSNGRFNSSYHAMKDNNSHEYSNSDSLFGGGVSDGRFNDDIDLDGGFGDSHDNENSGLKDSLKNFKRELLNKDEKSKSRFGKIAFVLIFLVLASSMLYFMVYQPFQEELNLEKNARLNELNALYKGPLEVHENAYSLKNQIESTNDLEELKSIDVLRTATDDWKTYHKGRIVKCRDNYNRVMLSYADNDTKNVILSVSDAQDFVKDNDAKVLSNVRFKKVDTVIVPISLSRLQATAGLISVGSIVDIYTLDENDTFDYSSDSNSDEITVESGDNSSDNMSNETSVPVSEEDVQSNDDSVPVSGEDVQSNDGSVGGDDNLELDKGPDVSGATVLAILRSKDSGVVDSKFSRSSLKVNGNVSTPKEKTNSFSTDVEELLKASAFGSYSGNGALESYLDSYGVKLSNYERMSNLGELDSEYILLLEVPRTDVDFIINNMDDLILTIPTQFAPDWVANELSQTYYEDITTQGNDSLF